MIISHLDFDHISGLHELLEDPELASRIETIVFNQLEYRLLWETARAKFHSPNVVRSRSSKMALRSLRSLQRFVRARSQDGADVHAEVVSPSLLRPRQYPLLLPLLEDESFRTSVYGPSQALRDTLSGPLERLANSEMTDMPLTGEFTWPSADWNSTSIVLAIEYAGRRILLPGDATASTWTEIFRRAGSSDLVCDVVVAWHHGAALGIRDGIKMDEVAWARLLNSAGDSSVLVSAGCGNPYGHPSIGTLEAVTRGRGKISCTQLKSRPEAAEAASRFPHAESFLNWYYPDWGGPVFRKPGPYSCGGDLRIRVSPDGTIDRHHTKSADHGQHCCDGLTGAF